MPPPPPPTAAEVPARHRSKGEEGERKREKGVREEEGGLTCGPYMSVGPHFFVCE
ncbi:hypothetical protein [Oryza sativa Japonica Group]|uniref:Uncharacterized protein n=1 Tax=Oryza sativa subsp. japonica TaxID=39947 RepID=Q5SN63_ORYSJ|nr:hypothetical protein [Oryza sativa Japonica Group]